MTSELRVDKEVHTVRLLLEDGSDATATIYVPIGIGGPANPHAVIDAIEQADGALPCRDEHSRFVLVGVDALCGVVCGQDDVPSDGFFTRHLVDVRLRGGHEFSGQLLHDVGAGDRMSDAFRYSRGWLQMEVDDELLWFRKTALVVATEAG